MSKILLEFKFYLFKQISESFEGDQVEAAKQMVIDVVEKLKDFPEESFMAQVKNNIKNMKIHKLVTANFQHVKKFEICIIFIIVLLRF